MSGSHRETLTAGNATRACGNADIGRFDRPAKVGRYRRDTENPTLWDVTIEPVCDIKHIKSVAVIVAAR